MFVFIPFSRRSWNKQAIILAGILSLSPFPFFHLPCCGMDFLIFSLDRNGIVVIPESVTSSGKKGRYGIIYEYMRGRIGKIQFNFP